MPQIIVTADDAHEQERDGVMLRERVNADDFESERFAANLIERLGWAVVDATEAETTTPSRAPRNTGAAHTGRQARRPSRRGERVHA